MKKILITGGLGFIGCHLVKYYLKRSFLVTVIDNLSTGQKSNLTAAEYKKIKIVFKDVSDQSIYRFVKNQDFIIHAAGLADLIPSIEDPESYFKSNIEGTFNLMSAVRKYNKKLKKFIYLASSTCYGIPKKYPTSEVSDIITKHPYANSKYIGEEIVRHYSNVFNINSNSLRLFNVYGTQSRTNSHYGAMFGVFLAQKIHNKPLTIVGNGRQGRDFLYVFDLVNAIDKILKKQNTKFFEYNIGYGKTVKVISIAKMISDNIIFIPKRPGEPYITHACTKRFQKEFKWKPKINITNGVNKLLENIDYWKKAPVWTKSSIKKETKSWFKYLKNK
jgi:UDP-glucose 4-epimerase